MSDTSDVPFSFSEVAVEGNLGVRGVLVMTPISPMVVDKDQLERALQSSSLSPVELGMLDRIERRSPNTPILILDACPNDENHWRFDPALMSSEYDEARAEFVCALMPFYRRVVAAGIVSFVHVGCDASDLIPLRMGLATLPERLRRRGSNPRRSALDEWIAKNLLLYSSLSLEHFTRTLLPQYIPTLARRVERARELTNAARL